MIKAPIKLYGKATFSHGGPERIVRVGDPANERWGARDVWLHRDQEDEPTAATGTEVVLSLAAEAPIAGGRLRVTLPGEFNYLGPGDILRLAPSHGRVNVLYRRSGRTNSLLLTERCNSNCTMCSQPPKQHNDEFIADELLQVIPLIDPATPEVGFTGGEPTLLHGRFLELVSACREHLPSTSLHVLTNGRLFAYREFARRLAAIDHPDLMLGVPLYSDLPWCHDHVVQARGAFDQTIHGLLNLARFEVPLELRVVIHRDTFARLPELARFIARNLPFVSHVALMGLEIMGHVRMNLDALWIDPLDYQRELARCVRVLEQRGITARIYNHQLCVLPEELWPYAVQSISDWKNLYVQECGRCVVRDQCGGFFASSSIKASRGIRAVMKECSVT